jgi:solute carrier family 25 (mitochondrial thiamine pyrophosphate transporter), member 19
MDHDKHPYPQWHNAVAGGVAGAGARLATAPLDLIRIRRQLERNVTYPRPSLWSSLQQVYRDEGGISALFRGNMAATYLWIGYSMVQFAVYSRLKHYLEGKDHNDDDNAGTTSSRSNTNNNDNSFELPRVPTWISTNPTAVAFLSGAGAGLCATVSTYPFDICRTVFAARGVIPAASAVAATPEAVATPAAAVAAASAASATKTKQHVSFEPPKSLSECASAMYRQRGLPVFFAGIKPAVVQIVPYMGMNFAIYDALTRGDRSVGLSAYAGMISGAVSKLIVYPMDTVKKRLQAQSVFGPQINSCGRYYTGLWHCLTTMIQKEGVVSLYRGIVPSVMKTTIGSGLSFSFFRMAKNGLEEIHDFSVHHYRSSSSGHNSRSV